MTKARDAFRTISEVADWLATPAHVLRFWETRFPQIKPVKRAGGRRYYRPEDMALIGGIKMLLHEQGMTIKGVQKLLREQGVRHVAALGPPPPGADDPPAQGADTLPAQGAVHVLTPAALHAARAPDAALLPPLTLVGAEAPAARHADAPPLAAMDPVAVAAMEDVAEVPGDEPMTDGTAEPAAEIAEAATDGPEASATGGPAAPLEDAADPSPEAAPAHPGALPPARPGEAPERYAAVFRMDADAVRLRAADVAPLFDRLAALRDRIARDVA